MESPRSSEKEKPRWQPPPVHEGIWPPVWKSLKECPQYQCILPSYIWLRSKVMGNVEYYTPADYNRILRFINRVIKSRCYDYDDCPPEVGKCFPLRVRSDAQMNSELSKRLLDGKLKVLVAKINEDAQKHGEYYEFHSFVKVVDSGLTRTSFLTMRVVTKDDESNGGVKTASSCIQRRVWRSASCFRVEVQTSGID